LFATLAVRVSSFIRFAIRFILPLFVLMLVVLPVFPAALVIRVSLEPAFVPVVSITVPVRLLVITTVILCGSGD
jgi:hypothetical protein